MKEIKDALVDLLKVKSLITLAIIGALVYLAITGAVEIAVFTSIASSILTYYFARKEKHNEENLSVEEKIHEEIIKILSEDINIYQQKNNISNK